MLKNILTNSSFSLAKCFAVLLAPILVVLLPTQTFAAFAPPQPPQNGYVLDQTNTLTPEEISSLNQQLDSYRQTGKAELGVFMTSKLEDSYLEEAALSTARSWGIGTSKRKNGVLIFIAKDDHKIRLEVGKGLEGELTDAYSSRIIKERIAPEFKKSQYYQGIKSGLEGIAGLLKLAEGIDTSDLKEDKDSRILLGLFVVIIIFAISIALRRRDKFSLSSAGKSSTRASSTGAAIGTATHTIKSHDDRPTNSSSPNSSSGFSGGGSFGGGGASGSW